MLNGGSSSPSIREQFLHADSVQDRGTGLPVVVFNLAVLCVKRVPRCCRAVDELTRRLLIVQSNLYPHILQIIVNFLKQPVDGLQPVGENVVHTILHRAPVP